jgi:predicted glycosyltransferase
MKILIDIGHPAHVHYFRNFIQEMSSEGHVFVIVARDKEVSQQLLRAYGLDFISRGKGATSRIGKILYMLRADMLLTAISLKHKPDLFLSVVSPYASQVAWLFGKPHIALDDTEHATVARKFYLPFSRRVLTPRCFNLDLGPKQRRMNSFFELFYLHPNRWKQEADIRLTLGLKSEEPFALLRFVSWGASHDYGQSGMPLNTKIDLVKRLTQTHRVFISAEGDVPGEMKPYLISIAPHHIHSVLYEADIYIGEGATMASECAMLGTPAIYYNSLEVSTIQEQSKSLLIRDCKTESQFEEAFRDMMNLPDKKALGRKKLSEYVQTLDDPNTDLIITMRECAR